MSRAALVALLLWVVTVAGGGYLFFRGYTESASDGREAVIVSESERNQILAEMRTMLLAVGTITAAIADGDLAAVAATARTVGTAAMSADSPALLAKLPFGLKEAGLEAHQRFDALADAAAAGAAQDRLLGMLAEQITVCAGCHALYSLSR